MSVTVAGWNPFTSGCVGPEVSASAATGAITRLYIHTASSAKAIFLLLGILFMYLKVMVILRFEGKYFLIQVTVLVDQFFIRWWYRFIGESHQVFESFSGTRGNVLNDISIYFFARRLFVKATVHPVKQGSPRSFTETGSGLRREVKSKPVTGRSIRIIQWSDLHGQSGVLLLLNLLLFPATGCQQKTAYPG
ncbi:hypothetical protein ACCC92_05835 [Mucilaginibacter sp. Mucisp84]|uniref:hypothetical protein n=1 Tax=Mucilaginibacter sp. Mucisp84 TaxID=3243058 RepID=UPI0039A67AB3